MLKMKKSKCLWVDGIKISFNHFISWLWNICLCIVTLEADDIPGNLFGSCRWTMNLATARKTEALGQKFIQVFPGNKKTWINCGESNSSESAAWTPLPLRIAKTLCYVPQQKVHRLRYLIWLGLNKLPSPLQGCWCPSC